MSNILSEEEKIKQQCFGVGRVGGRQSAWLCVVDTRVIHGLMWSFLYLLQLCSIYMYIYLYICIYLYVFAHIYIYICVPVAVLVPCVCVCHCTDMTNAK